MIIEERFSIHVVESDIEHRAVAPYLAAQRDLFDQFTAFTDRLFACNCTLEQATFRYEIKHDFLNHGPTRERMTHHYTMRGMVSAESEEDMTHLIAGTTKKERHDYDAIQAVYYLERNRDGEVVRRVPIDPESFRFLVTREGGRPAPPFPAYMQVMHDMPLMMFSHQNIEIMWKDKA